MKKILFTMPILAAGLLAVTSCSQDDLCVGEGNVILSATYNNDVKIVSRASLEEELGESTLIWISSEKGLVREFKGVESLPTEGIKLTGGHYIAEAWAGDSLSADYEKKYYKGREDFDIQNGTQYVNIECKIANVVASVKYDESLDDALTDYTMTIGHRRGSLDFVGRDAESLKGYYMMPSNDPDLTWTLIGTQSDGSQFVKTGKIPAAQSATEYVLTVRYNPQNEELGGAFIEVVVDESAIEYEDSVTVTAAPRIDGIGFNINEPVYGQNGDVGKKSVYVTGAVSLRSVLIEGDDLTAMIGGPDIELMGADEEVIDDLRSHGIFFQMYDVVTTNSNMKISFDEEFTNKIEGQHTFVITATDVRGKSRTATLTFNITDALLALEPIDSNSPAIWATSVTLEGTILKDAADNIGFDYKQQGAGEWMHIDATTSRAAGDKFYAQLTGLKPGTTYVYRAVSGEFTTSEFTFTTEQAPQLPNSSFEDWFMDGKTQRIYAQGGQMFWDSGNAGSSTVGTNLTTPSKDYVKSGTYSAKLASQKVAIAFAAGNMFIGEFLGVENLSKGILGWGRPFTGRPKALKGYVKYTPAEVSDGATGLINKGDMDQGIIYIAILDDSTMSYGKYSGWPQIVATKDINNYGFSKDKPNVIGYGEKVFTTATNGDGLIEFEIPIEYFRNDVKASNIILTCSASRYGDYYAGGASVMYLDDFELVY